MPLPVMLLPLASDGTASLHPTWWNTCQRLSCAFVDECNKFFLLFAGILQKKRK